MRVIGTEALPPWVDTVQQGNGNYWVSPAMPLLPARETRDDGRFEALALTARAESADARRIKRYVELRLVRIGMTLTPDGTAVPDDTVDGGLYQTLAYGALPIDKFIALVLPRVGRSATSYEVTFYETGANMANSTVGGGYYEEPTISVKVARGIDMPGKKASLVSDVSMMFVFGEGGKSLRKFARGLRTSETGETGETGEFVVQCPIYLDEQGEFVFGFAKRIIPHGRGSDVLTADLGEARRFKTKGEAEKAARTLLGKTFHEMNVARVEDVLKAREEVRKCRT